MRGLGLFGRVFVGSGVVLGIVCLARAEWQDQAVSLRAGWNPVYLEVAPEPAAVDAHFAGSPRVLSVRQWQPLAAEDVLYDATAGTTVPQGGSWRTWFPPSSSNRPLSDLIYLSGHSAYLIEVSAGANTNFTLRGHIGLRALSWRDDSFHFVGLPVRTPGPVYFDDYFAPAAAALPTHPLNGGQVYRVQADGTHAQVFQPALIAVNRREAYWIRAAEAVDFTGAIEATVESASGWMDFGSRLVPQILSIRNASTNAVGVEVAQLASAPSPAGQPPGLGAVPLRVAAVTPEGQALGLTYSAFVSPLVTQLAARATLRLAWVPDASGIAAGAADSVYQSLLRVRDVSPSPGYVEATFGVRVSGGAGSVTDPAGLWVGEAVITEVARLQMLGVLGVVPPNPVAVDRPFQYRLLVHVDTEGRARLLQRVLVASRLDASGEVVTELLADESLVAAHRANHPDAKLFRVSSTTFPFMDPLPLDGGRFGVPVSTLSGTVTVRQDDPVNPFRHAYHPQHDNLEQRAATRVPYADDVEVYTVRREIELQFDPPPLTNPDPRWGATLVGGVYREDIYGLGGRPGESNRVIQCRGTFSLVRAATSGALVTE